MPIKTLTIILCLIFFNMPIVLCAVELPDYELSFKEKQSYEQLTVPSGEYFNPGIYESDDIEWILSRAFENFEPNDIVVLDIDDVLITQRLDPFYFEHVKNKTPLYEKFNLLERRLKDKYFSFINSTQSSSVISLMDERIPILIKRLQSNGVKCIGNTALSPTFGSFSIFDAATPRLQLLGEFGIDFSCTFSHLELWGFDTLCEEHIIKSRPLFKQGVIFSSYTPKYISQYELFRKMEIMPKRMMFVDDSAENVSSMHAFFSSLGVQCYSCCYLRKKSKPTLNYFSEEAYKKELEIIESFIKNLLKETDD